MDDDIERALKSKDPEQQIDGAIRAGDLGILGIRYVDELLKLITSSDNDEVRCEAISALREIPSYELGLGTFEVSAVPILISVLRDSQLANGAKCIAASTLSCFNYSVFPNKTEILEEVDDATLEFATSDQLKSDPIAAEFLLYGMNETYAEFCEFQTYLTGKLYEELTLYQGRIR